VLTTARPSWFGAVAAGAAWGLASPDGPIGAALVLIGAIAACLSVEGKAAPDAARGALVGLICWGLQLRWVPLAWDRFAGGDGLVAYAVAVLLQALPFALIWAVARKPLGLALAWAAAEPLLPWVQPLPSGPALLMAGAPALVWPAAWGGRSLLTGLAVGWGALAARRPALAAALLGGWALGSLLPTGPAEGSTRIGVIQPQIGAFDARRASTADVRAARLLDAIDAAGAAGADWIATPEGAWPHVLPGQTGSVGWARLVETFEGRPPVLLGASVGDGSNSLVVIERGDIRGRMDKEHLVPVAEAAAFGYGRDRYRAGDGARVVPIAGVRAAVLVCYEDLWPSAVRRADRDGADVLVAASNDAWVGPGIGSAQHLAATRLAAVETGRWAVRPTTSGQSAVVDPSGRVVWSAAWIDGDAVPDAPIAWTVAEVPLRRPLWSGARVGPWVAALAALTLLAARR
jgi:apolipoprotein N-acyltransferase